MCQCLKFVYFSPVQDVTVLVHLQGSTSSLRRTSTPVPGRPAPETPAGGGELHLGGLFCQLQKLLREEVSGGGPGAGVVINGLSLVWPYTKTRI